MQPFVVKLVGLAKGPVQMDWTVGQEFFEEFGNADILKADVKAAAILRNHGITVDVSCDIEGSVTVACDRCLEELVIPVETSFEETYTPESDELDISQEVYDYVCISLPIQKVHKDGECNSDTTRFLSK